MALPRPPSQHRPAASAVRHRISRSPAARSDRSPPGPAQLSAQLRFRLVAATPPRRMPKPTPQQHQSTQSVAIVSSSPQFHPRFRHPTPPTQTSHNARQSTRYLPISSPYFPLRLLNQSSIDPVSS